jgi:aminopeptidase N
MSLSKFRACLQACAVACVGMVAFAPAALGQRLPTDVRPEHYTLKLTPDLEKATFTGVETIEVTLGQAATSITLNAAEIDFQKVTVEAGGKTQTAQVSLDKAKQQATLTVPQQIPAGKATLRIEYTGILNNELRGFYLSKTAKRNYAVTQFEPTDARRAFPSFDEPAYKATFDTTLVVDKGDTAISNTNVVADTPGPGDKHTVHFATTPKMSTYLVAFLVGDFKCVSGSSDGVPIRACTTPEKVQYANFALQTAEFVLHYYDTYFGIKYPMPKLDMIGIPDFEAGAMENFGAITYRESDMLVDEKNASVSTEKNVASVVAHEMAHQWFGDMVTMQWWNNIWLNEGFATWMENKPIAAWKPEWNVNQDVVSDLNGALNLDAQRVTRTIRAEANTPDQINEMFDGITYQKAGAVLLMVENYLGKEVFRQGVHNYLAAHKFGNATAEDFWISQTANSNKPVDKIMESFVAQPGEPLLTFDRAQGGNVNVSQKRFFLNPKEAPAARGQSWTVPVCFKYGVADQACELLSSGQQSLKTPQSPFLFADAGGKGYYRFAYDPADYNRMLSNVESGLRPTERIMVVGNEFALVRAGQASVGDYLNLASAVKADDSADVIGSVAGGLRTIYDQVAATDAERKEVAAWARETFSPELKKLGMPSASDTPERKELRASLFQLLGEMDDPAVISDAKQITGQFLKDPASVDATLAQPAIFIAADHGDAQLFDAVQQAYESSKDPAVHEAALRAMAVFSNPELEKRALDYVVSGKVRNQDSVIELAIMLRVPDTRNVAWQYIQANWPKVKAQLTEMMGGYLVGAAGGFCSADKREQVTNFFTQNPVPAAARALTRAQNQIGDCMDLRAAQQPKLEQWLSSRGGAGAARGGE